MRRGGLLVVAAIAGGCGGSSRPAATPPPPAPDSVTLHYAVPAVGDRWIEEQSQSLDMVVAMGAQKTPFTAAKREQSRWQVLEVAADTVTKAKVTYVVMDRSQRADGAEQATPSLLTGKTYVLAAGAPVVVTSETGVPSDAEIAEIREAEIHFGQPESLSKLLDGKTFTKDVEVDLPPDEIARAMGNDQTTKVKLMSLTLRGRDGDLALFDTAMEMEQAAGPGTFVMALTGTATIDPRTNDLVMMSVAGSITLVGQVTGEGTMQMTERHTR